MPLETELTTAPRRAGPKGSFFLGNLQEFGRDPLGFLERCVRDYGDFVPLRFLNRPVCLLNNPADIEYVLTANSRNFRKTLGYRTPFMRRLFGQGLLTSEGDLWLRQRRLAQPAFHRDRIATYATTIVEFTERFLTTWQAGEMRAIHRDMMRLTTEVVVQSLFHSDVPSEIENMNNESVVVLEHFTKQWSVWRLFSSLLPSPGKRRFEQLVRRLDEFIYGVIRERRASGKDAGDLLSMLLQARDEHGQGMNDRQLRDELTTLILAGLDTTALALSWAFYLLSQNLAAADKLFAELQTVLAGRTPRFTDLPQLRYTEMIVKETMRLYPSAWLIGREAIHDCEIGGHRIAAGTSLVMSQWLKHRDRRYFESPDKFIPERWTDEFVKTLPKCAYFPFGGGPRLCIGHSFAMMEGMLVLATVGQKFRVTSTPGYAAVPWPSITLQPKEGIHLRVERRQAPSSN